MIKQKYQPVLDLGTELNIQHGDVSEDNGILTIKGTTKTLYEKNILWDKIKSIGGTHPTDIKADIRVLDQSVYHRHTVKRGETLGKIAKHYYGDPMKYIAIFKANSHILADPDLIHPDQELVIPNL